MYASEIVNTKHFHLEFWTGFRKFMEDSGTNLKLRKPQPKNWYAVTVKTPVRIGLNTHWQQNRIACGLYIGGNKAKAIYSSLEKNKAKLEKELGNLVWEPLPEGNDCRIAQYRYDCDLSHRSKWPEFYEWLRNRLEAFYKSFSPLVKELV